MFYSLWYIFTLFVSGLGSGITVRVGHLLAAYDPKKAYRTAMISIVYGEFVVVVSAILLYGMGQPLSDLFTTDNTFARKLAFNIKIMCFITLSDIHFFAAGVMNACCMQGSQAVIKFFFRVILGIIISIAFTYYVKWKAIGLFLSMGIVNCLSFFIVMVILTCRSWEEIAEKVTENTQKKRTTTQEEEEEAVTNSHVWNSLGNHDTVKKCKSDIRDSKSYNIVRYCLCLSIGILLFVATAYYHNY